jgi:prepilin-type N-terminal cleavage/methylation domain-containing protein/prepilin-type processing-associated H-X9-DG protein
MMQQNSFTRHALRPRNGFTLIELLVVIAIIAILAAILFPVFARARENARRASCQSNLKQIGLGVMQYTQDYDERYPQDWSVGANRAYNWDAALQPYLKSTQVYQCPSEPTAQGDTSLGAIGHVDYAYNKLLTQVGPAPSYLHYGRMMSEVEAPALSIMFSEIPARNIWLSMQPRYISGSETGEGCVGRIVASTSPHCSSNAALDRVAAARHLETANYVYADGHVKAHRPDAIFGAATTWFTSGQNPTFRVVP